MLTTIIVALACLMQDPAAAGESDAIKLLREVDQATKALRTAQYDATWHGTGAFAGTAVSSTGTVILEKKEGTAWGRYRLDGAYFLPREEGDVQKTFRMVSDGTTMVLVDDSEQRMARQSSSSRGWTGTGIHMVEFIHPTPFQDEINANVAEIEGRTMVGDVLCDVVYIEYAVGQGVRARWYFGAEDHLPRKVERLNEADGLEAAMVLEVTNLQVGIEIDPERFVLIAPEGYTESRVPPGARLRPTLRPQSGG